MPALILGSLMSCHADCQIYNTINLLVNFIKITTTFSISISVTAVEGYIDT